MLMSSSFSDRFTPPPPPSLPPRLVPVNPTSPETSKACLHPSCERATRLLRRAPCQGQVPSRGWGWGGRIRSCMENTLRLISHCECGKIKVEAGVRSCVTRFGMHGQKSVKDTRSVAVIESDSASSISSLFISRTIFSRASYFPA